MENKPTVKKEEKKALVLRNSLTSLTKGAAKVVSKRMSLPLDKMQVIVNGYRNKIRDLNQTEAVNHLQKSLAYLTKLYMGVQLGAEDTPLLVEGADFVRTKYSHLGLEEIREAFRLANDLQVNLKAYYGTFSLISIGELLDTYTKYRNKVIDQLIDQQKKIDEQKRKDAEREDKNVQARQDAIETFKLAVKARNELPLYDHWSKVPQNWHDILLNEGLIEVTPELKKDVAGRAKDTARLEFERCIYSDHYVDSDKAHAKKVIKLLDSGELHPDFVARWKSIYSKKIVWQYIKPNEDD